MLPYTYAISVGNPFDGLSLWGPFATLDAATKWATEEINEDYNTWDLVTLNTPLEEEE